MGGGVFRRLADLARASPAEVGLMALLSAGVIAGSAYIYARTRPTPPEIRRIPAPVRDRRAVEVAPKPLVVHVAGMVAAPGVYELPAGSRVKDALAAAGGPLEGADLAAINLAALLEDGQKVLVPKPGEPPPPEGDESRPPVRISLNTATKSDLEQLPGVGPVLAQRILDYRRRRGRFTAVRELLEVGGVGPRKFEELKELVRI
ncbi:MAG: helix-hairpin-helix domain-containing protein [Actinomycetota bacterium]